MSYHIPEDVIAKAHKAYKESTLPGQDAMAAAIRAIKQDLWEIVEFEIYLNKELDELNAESRGF